MNKSDKPKPGTVFEYYCRDNRQWYLGAVADGKDSPWLYVCWLSHTLPEGFDDVHCGIEWPSWRRTWNSRRVCIMWEPEEDQR